MRSFEYETCCVHSDAESIHEMTDAAREITYRTFMKYVDVRHLQGVGPFSSYTYRGEKINPVTGEEVSRLFLKNDWAVSYHKSNYRGRPCYYIRHSAIEWIFTERQ